TLAVSPGERRRISGEDMANELHSDLVEDVGARLDIERGPGRRRGTGGRDGAIGLLRIRLRVLADQVAHVRWVHVARDVRALDPLARDEVGMQLVRHVLS